VKFACDTEPFVLETAGGFLGAMLLRLAQSLPHLLRPGPPVADCFAEQEDRSQQGHVDECVRAENGEQWDPFGN
jgi:hypothetical protein